MNTTQPPANSPLHRKINAKVQRCCGNCKHIWFIDETFYCGKTGKYIIDRFVWHQFCEWHEIEEKPNNTKNIKKT